MPQDYKGVGIISIIVCIASLVGGAVGVHTTLRAQTIETGMRSQQVKHNTQALELVHQRMRLMEDRELQRDKALSRLSSDVDWLKEATKRIESAVSKE